MLAVHKLLNLVLRDVLDVGLAGVQHLHFFGVGIEPRHLMAGFGEPEAQRQAYVSTADNGNLQLGAFEKLGFPVAWHNLLRTPRFFWEYHRRQGCGRRNTY